MMNALEKSLLLELRRIVGTIRIQGQVFGRDIEWAKPLLEKADAVIAVAEEAAQDDPLESRIRKLAFELWDDDEFTVEPEALVSISEEGGAWVQCWQYISEEEMKDNGLLVDPYEVAARAAGWEHGGDCGGFWYNDKEFGHWKAAASNDDAVTFETAQEVCEHLGIEIAAPALIPTPDPGKPEEGATA